MLFLYVYLTIAGLGILSMPSLKLYAEKKWIPIELQGVVQWDPIKQGYKSLYNWFDIDIWGKFGDTPFFALPVFFVVLLLTWPAYIPTYLAYKVVKHPILAVGRGMVKAHSLLQLPAKLMLKEKQLPQKNPYLLEGEREVEKMLKERV